MAAGGGLMGKLKVINLWAEPGAGKSTTAAGLFNLMKLRGESVELVTEYAKERVYQSDRRALQNQLYMLAKQDMALWRLQGQVEWAITDSPLPLAVTYSSEEFKAWIGLVMPYVWMRYDNYNFLIHRAKPYQKIGRVQTEEEAAALKAEIAHHAWRFGVLSGHDAIGVKGDHRAPHEIAAKIGLWDGAEL
jgi:hypothetical protein